MTFEILFILDKSSSIFFSILFFEWSAENITSNNKVFTLNFFFFIYFFLKIFILFNKMKAITF